VPAPIGANCAGPSRRPCSLAARAPSSTLVHTNRLAGVQESRRTLLQTCSLLSCEIHVANAVLYASYASRHEKAPTTDEESPTDQCFHRLSSPVDPIGEVPPEGANSSERR
jgi:hypothetical protein